MSSSGCGVGRDLGGDEDRRRLPSRSRRKEPALRLDAARVGLESGASSASVALAPPPQGTSPALRRRACRVGEGTWFAPVCPRAAAAAAAASPRF